MLFVLVFLVILTAMVSVSRPRVVYGGVRSPRFTIDTGDVLVHYHRENRFGLMSDLQAIVVHAQITHVAVVWKNRKQMSYASLILLQPVTAGIQSLPLDSTAK